MKYLRARFQNNERIFEELSHCVIRLYPEKNCCIICNKKTNLLKTSGKDCYSFHFGKFTLIEGFFFCNDHKYVSEDSSQILKYHSQLATEIVDRGHRVTIDMVVKVGLLRYRDHLQLDEIKTFLKCSPAKIDFPVSTIGMISKRFLEFCKLFHKKHEYKIKEDINSNGGFVAHYDGTTEKKSGIINFVVKDSLSRHILVSEMIQSENYEEVSKILRKVKFKYGYPLTTVSDLKPGFLSVSEDTFDKKVPHKFCDYHFLRTFKNDFVSDHGFIKTRLCSTWKITSSLHKQLKSVEYLIDKKEKKVCKDFKEIEKYWEHSKDVLQTYRLILQWILRFKQACSGKGIPFDLPYLDLYDRLIQGKKLIDVIFTKADISIEGQYCNFNTLIEKMNNTRYWSPKFRKSIKMLKFSRKWFNKLRGVLMLGALQDDQDPLAPLSKRYQLTEEEAKAIPKNIKSFLEEIEIKISSCKNPKKIKILSRFRDQTNKYQNNLKLPLIVLTVSGVVTTLIPSRTNNCLESFFRLIKSLLRRNTGRSALTKEFASVGALLPYYVSMKNHKTFKSIFEDEDRLSEEFAAIIKDKCAINTQDNLIDLERKFENNNENYFEIQASAN